MSADIDIDFFDRKAALAVLPHVVALRAENTPHNTGVYFQNIPYNPITMQATIDYKEADARGFFKMDFLNVSVYKDVKDEEHLIQLMNRAPLWDLLLQEDFVNLLFHVNGHGDILKKTCPTSIEQLAAVLAIIRPAKRYLIGKDWDTIMNEVWVKPETDEYFFKKSHAIAYAVAIVVQMNLICDNLTSSET